ncbi:hypothetical protein AMAG_05967 [Allomyces macrogynus ATCC 38327]|uniref:Cwf15/Cwc15 cell cycle control protein n=1 Tax=Allomyces macrogynus (strain ATCC 38327) TaxID=578462 RepID=A0A0L0SDM5_ALLM3|nr:hypothetical protein AMAG_05967 [Allomyces macrogynus ATCC 38327]|eukprot:KNE60586.1 hypothetical protein AMAG_05967 [Allomyces macrogynus ATCC 38327]
MTTAARPTFNPAMGGHTGRDLGYISQIRSSKELPGYKTLKLRQPGQHSAQEVKARDLKSELQQAEREFRAKKRKLIGGSGADNDMDEDADGGAPLEQALRTNTDDDGDDDHSSRRRAPKRPRHAAAPEDDDPDADLAVSDDDNSHADSDDDASRSDSDRDDDDDDDDSEDETEALMRELEKIKRERAEERERQEAAKRAEEEEALMAGIPLLSLGRGAPADFSIKKRWDDDVVFKNQARTEEKPVRRFINDTIRSDFHRKFLHNLEVARNATAEWERVLLTSHGAVDGKYHR